ncbi:MAG TPA: alkaline phosphatase family protein, partial [Pseudonocardiaceae bacterium]
MEAIAVPELTRRRLLGTAAGVTAAAAAATLMPANVAKALAQDAPKSGSMRDIEHVVVLMQENRSFDHYYGTLSGVRGFADAERQKLAIGGGFRVPAIIISPWTAGGWVATENFD